MTDVTAYTLAWIGGGFTVLGALIGVLTTFWLAVVQERRRERRSAIAAFRAALAPALAQLYLARHHGTHDRPVLGDILREALMAHATAVELFRPLVADEKQFQADWEQYRQFVRQDNWTIDGAEWGTDDPLWSTVEGHIRALLSHAVDI